MKFATEQHLQAYCLQVLESKGIPTRKEVWTTSGIRADIVTPDAVIELKKVLDRNAIYQALGQGTAYQRDLHCPLLWIVGQLPSDPQHQTTARTVAKAVTGNGVRVSFIEEDPFWQIRRNNFFDGWNDSPPFTNSLSESRKLLSIILLVTMLAIANTTLKRLSQSASPAPENLPAVPSGSAAIAPVAASTPVTRIALPPLSLNSPSVKVKSCGQQNALANFRSQPTLDPNAVVGVLQPGQTVYLTGQQVQTAGVLWIEVLIPLSNGTNQFGWLASCFVQS